MRAALEQRESPRGLRASREAQEIDVKFKIRKQEGKLQSGLVVEHTNIRDCSSSTVEATVNIARDHNTMFLLIGEGLEDVVERRIGIGRKCKVDRGVGEARAGAKGSPRLN